MSYIQLSQRDLLGIVKYPILTEKAIKLLEQNQYSFAVDPKANKNAINVVSCAIQNDYCLGHLVPLRSSACTANDHLSPEAPKRLRRKHIKYENLLCTSNYLRV